jgi:hypothetical protein
VIRTTVENGHFLQYHQSLSIEIFKLFKYFSTSEEMPLDDFLYEQMFLLTYSDADNPQALKILHIFPNESPLLKAQ